MQRKPAIADKAKMAVAILNNDIVEAEYKCHHIIPIFLEVDVKVDHDNKWRTYSEGITQL